MDIALRAKALPCLQCCTSIHNAFFNLWHIRPCQDAQRVPFRLCQALQKLDCSHNRLTGDLEPLRGCIALTQLWLTHNQLVGGLEPLEGCTALQGLCN